MLSRFFIPKWVRYHNRPQPNPKRLYHNIEGYFPLELKDIIEGLQQFKTENPVVSIVIPAYNEEHDLLKTLSSLAALKPKYPTELIVANNNSTDGTQAILDICGVKSVFEKRQGISYARQAGLEAAKGTYILSADADSIYPNDWGNRFIEVLINHPEVACVYGRYSFIPHNGSALTRIGLALHELLAEFAFNLRPKHLECVNVMGFNFAYRKADALDIGGFKHNLNRAVTQRSEDGWMALELSKLGAVKLVHTKNRVWTSDRRLMNDGSLWAAFTNRIRRYLKNMFSQPQTEISR